MSYIALQEAFFSRRQQEGETLLEFSLVLMSLLERVKRQSPHALVKTETVLRDQFVEHVNDSTFRRELKQLVRRQPNSTLLDVRSEALRWEREGMPGGVFLSRWHMEFSMVYVGICRWGPVIRFKHPNWVS